MIRSRCHICFFLLMTILGFSLSQNKSFAKEVYPQKPIEIIVPAEPGGPTDIGIRIEAEQLSKVLKTKIIVINKAGGGGIVGTNEVVKSKKDGYTLLGTSSTPIISMPIIKPKEVPYDPINDFEPLAHSHLNIVDLVVKGDSSFNTFQDLEKYVKANPGKLNMGVPGAAIQPYFIFHHPEIKGLDMNSIR